MTKNAQCKSAVEAIEKRLECLQCSDGSIVKLVQFSHQSPGLIALRKKIAEAIIMHIEESHSIGPKA